MTLQNLVVLKLSDPMPFGKYRGKTVAQVLEVNPEYVRWFGDNVTTHAFALEVGPALKKAMHYCSPSMMARVYRYQSYPSFDDDGAEIDNSWGGQAGLTDDDMRNDP